MHHPPFPVGIPSLDAISLANPLEFSEIVEEYANIRHLFFGHVHRPVSGSWKGVAYSSLFSFVHQCALNFEKDDVISYSLEPPAYAVVDIAQDLVVVNTCYYQDNTAWRPQKRPSVDYS
jgi:3',5'-cyclic AMP phosphodiesterase CpdA